LAWFDLLDLNRLINSGVCQNSSISHWLFLGAPAEKLILGFPTYGRTYRLASTASFLGAPAIGAGEAGPYTRTAGFWSYYEVMYQAYNYSLAI